MADKTETAAASGLEEQHSAPFAWPTFTLTSKRKFLWASFLCDLNCNWKWKWDWDYK
jgi:hypothetical protein